MNIHLAILFPYDRADLYFASPFAHNIGIALILFAIIAFVCRKKLTLTALRAAYVFLIGWIGGSLLVFLIHLSFGMTGTLVGDRSEDGLLAILAIFPLLYGSYNRLSQPMDNRAGGIPWWALVISAFSLLITIFALLNWR